MITTVVVSAYRVAAAPDVGGHFWIPLQYVYGPRQLGCEVFWLEELAADKRRRWPSAHRTFPDRLTMIRSAKTTSTPSAREAFA